MPAAERVKKIWDNVGSVLHEISPYLDFPPPEYQFKAELQSLLNGLRADHQWIWNGFWHHRAMLGGRLFFIDFGDVSNSEPPRVIRDEKLAVEEIRCGNLIEIVADYEGQVDWSQFDSETDKE